MVFGTPCSDVGRISDVAGKRCNYEIEVRLPLGFSCMKLRYHDYWLRRFLEGFHYCMMHRRLRGDGFGF